MIAISLLLLLSGAAFLQAQPAESTVVARINGEAVLESEIVDVFASQFRNLAVQEFELKKRALDEVIARHLVQKQAAKLGIKPEELLPREVDSKVPDPTQAELEAFSLGQRDRLNRPFMEVQPQLFEALKQARIQQKREEYLSKLRDGADIQVLLNPPRSRISYDPRRVRGDAAAPVTIVEFSDFQCPFCRQSQEALRTVMEKYSGSVKIAFRDFPLNPIHPNAQAAAEAARCAAEQGRFWEYHDLLFANGQLTESGLAAHARTVGLDEEQFRTCVVERKYRTEVEADTKEAGRLGLTGTPAFFINGIFLSGAQPAAAFEKIIDQELQALRRSTTNNPAAGNR